METYLLLLRGINVGGKNKVPMAELKSALQGLGFSDVLTYIASGNVVLRSKNYPAQVKNTVEQTLPKVFVLDDNRIKVLVLTHDQLKDVVENKPDGFGESPEKYHSDVIFTIDVDTSEIMPLFKPREGVDKIWQGEGVVYSQRLSTMRTKSRLNVIASTPQYKSLTIRTWNTTLKLLDIMNSLDK